MSALFRQNWMLNKKIEIMSKGKIHEASGCSGTGTASSKLTQISKTCLHEFYKLQLLDRMFKPAFSLLFVPLLECILVSRFSFDLEKEAGLPRTNSP